MHARGRASGKRREGNREFHKERRHSRRKKRTLPRGCVGKAALACLFCSKAISSAWRRSIFRFRFRIFGHESAMLIEEKCPRDKEEKLGKPRKKKIRKNPET